MRAFAQALGLAVLILVHLGCGAPSPKPESASAPEATESQPSNPSPPPVLVALPAPPPPPPPPPVEKVQYRGYVNASDLMTTDYQLYAHHLEQACEGADFAQWPLAQTLVGFLGDAANAPMLAHLATQTIRISDQQRAKPVIQMVKECSRILGIDPPAVHIEGESEPTARITDLKAPHVLVLSSGLLDLYEERPDELRFIIGHALGLIKIKYARAGLLAEFFVGAIQKQFSFDGTIKGHIQKFVLDRALAGLLHWHREAKYAADRAGLLCVGGDLRTAQQALLRLNHRTKPSNELLDRDHPDFDEELILRNQCDLLEEPFVKIVALLSMNRSCPYVHERCASLKQWSGSGDYERLWKRGAVRPQGRKLIVQKVEVARIPKVDQYIPFVAAEDSDPLVKLTHNGHSRTTEAKTDQTAAEWDDLGFEFAYAEGGKLILDLYDYNAVAGNWLIGSCLVSLEPNESGQAEYAGKLKLGILSEPCADTKPKVTVYYRWAHD